MIDHISIPVRDLTACAAFYEKVLTPIGFGKNYPEFWINLRPNMEVISDDTGNHVCLRAPSEDAVNAFYEAATEGGRRGGGATQSRQASVTTYFGVFIRDLDGNKIEAVTFSRD